MEIKYTKDSDPKLSTFLSDGSLPSSHQYYFVLFQITSQHSIWNGLKLIVTWARAAHLPRSGRSAI